MPKVLIAEDNVILADILEHFLIFGGYEICGIAHTVTEAVALADLHKPDLAVVDFRLADGGYGSDIRPLLQDKDTVGILYVSADALNDKLTKADGEACIRKPYGIEDLLQAVRIVHEIKTKGNSGELPFPKNFYLLGKQADRQSA